MRIACLSTILGYPWGSPDRLWTELARRGRQRGDEIFLGLSALTADHPEVAGLCGLGAQLFRRAENSVYRGLRDTLHRRLPWHRRDYLEPQLARFNPDVVVITQGATYDSLSEHHLVQWLESSRVPYVVLCHNNPPGPAPDADEVARLRRFFAGAAHTLFVSSENLRVAEQHLGGPLPRADLIQNPLAVQLPAALPSPPVRATPVLGVIGRLDASHKGLDLLFAAMAALPAPRPRLVLTGRCDEADALHAMIARHGLRQVVELRGAVPAGAVTAAYAELDLFLLTSRYEGCASAMLEAMMAGRPVLATPVGGVGDWLEDGVSGYVAPEISSEAVRATLARALAARENWPALGAAARRTFEARRDPDPTGSLLRRVDASVNVPASP